MLKKLYRRLRIRDCLTRAVNLSGAAFGIPHLSGYCPACDRRIYRWKPFERAVGRGTTRLEPEERLCPLCGSFERTRHFALYLRQTGLLKNKPRFLHFAPERGLERRLRSALGDRYRTTDLHSADVDLRQDIAAMTFANGSFDFIYCSNVLEHVENDREAMKELHRVLSRGGVAFIQVPIEGDTTYENPSIADPEGRAEHFGQADHLRLYGRDIRDRLAAAGFSVEELYMPDILRLSRDEVDRMNLSKRELVHRCTKPA